MADTLYLVRHGEAKSKQEDPNRGLTDAGRTAAERMARWAVTAGVAVDEIRHSGKLRAEQTAALFAEHLLPQGPEPVAMSGLGPNDDVVPVAEAIEEEERSLMLVGHLPFLARLVAYLVTGSPEQPMVQFDAAAMVALHCEHAESCFLGKNRATNGSGPCQSSGSSYSAGGPAALRREDERWAVTCVMQPDQVA